jgi:hypothetical protein
MELDLGIIRDIENGIRKKFYKAYGLDEEFIRMDTKCVSDCPFEPPAIRVYCPCERLQEESFEHIKVLSHIQYHRLYIFLIQNTTAVTAIASATDEDGNAVWGLSVLYDSHEYSSHAMSFNTAILQAYISMPESWRTKHCADVQRLCNG